MKNFTKKSTIQKIVFMIVILLLVNFTLSPYSVYADTEDDDGWSIGGTLAKEVMGLFTWIGDIITGALNNFMLGANGFGSSMLSQNDPNLTNPKSWICVKDPDSVNKEDEKTIVFETGEIDTSLVKWGAAKFSIPNMLYSPENIFANNIAALDINFLRANEYQSIYVAGDEKFEENANEKSTSATKDLKTTIASWYKSFRNIAIVGLLSVLIYLGIRTLISTAATDKAKYKEMIQDWVVALCMIFVIHFIMSAVLMITDKCTELFGTSIDEGFTVVVEGEKRDDGKPMAFKTNLMGLVRFSAQNHRAGTAATYSIIYWALVIYTCMFTVLYFKRFLYMAFFTMIAPMVALTYPIDRAGDGKSQAFNMWFKEYTMNAIIQPVHLILYTVFVGSAYNLVAKNPLYALVAIWFLIPAEKFVKKMFGLDKAESSGGFGSFAGGAVAMSGLKHLANLGSGGKSKKGSGDKGGSDSNSSDDGIFMPSSKDGDLSTFGEGMETPPIEDKPSTMERAGDAIQETLEEQRNRELYEKNQQEQQQAIKEAEANGYARSDAEHNSNHQEEIEKNNELLMGNATPTNVGKQKKFARTRAVGRVIGRGAGRVGRQVWRNKGNYAKGVAGFAAKTALRGAGAVALAAPALAAGITTGDISKVAQFVGAGAIAGSTLGGSLYNGVAAPAAAGAVNAARDARGAYQEELYGAEEAERRQRERENAKARKNFMLNESEIKKYRALKAKMGYSGNVKDLMSAAVDYKEAGVKNDELIQNALKAEYKKNGSVDGSIHKQFVDVASFADQNGYGKDYIDDDKKRTSLENVISSTIKDPNAQREAAQTFADIFDRGPMYERVGKLGKPTETNKPNKK